MTSRAPFAVLLCAVFACAGSARAEDDAAASFRARIGAVGALGRAGSHEEAVAAATALVAEAERTFGPDSLVLADALAMQSRAMGHARGMGKGDSVDPEVYRAAAVRCLAIRERVLGPDHPDVGKAAWALAVTHDVLGEHSASARVMERSFAILQKQHGPVHADVAKALLELGVAYSQVARYRRALELEKRSEEAYAAATGADSTGVAAALQAQALAVQKLGDVAQAEDLLRRALAIREVALGPDHFLVSQTLQYLGVVLAERAAFTDARAALERALAIREKSLGPRSHQTGVALLELANVLRQEGHAAGARAALERALAIHEVAAGPTHPAVAADLHRLAEAMLDQGLPAEALPHALRALGIREQRLGADHPYTADTRLLVARLTADDAAALPLLARAVEGARVSLAPFHPLATRALRELARRRLAAGDRAGALDAALHAEDGAREWLQLALRSLDERGALDAAAGAQGGLAIALSALGPGSDAESVARVFDAVVRSRALVLDEMAARHRAARSASDPEVARLEEALGARRERLARLALRAAGDGASAYRALVDEARREKAEAEAELAQRSRLFREERDAGTRGAAAVRAALGPGDALLAYVRYQVEPARDGAAYAAFVVRAGSVSFVPIASGGAVEESVRLWRDGLVAGRGQAAARGDAAAERLRRTAWDAAAAGMSGAARVFVVPDGALHLVSFAALPARKGRYLLETGPRLHYLSAERDLVAAAAADEVRGRGLLAFGDPDFEGGPRPPARAAFRSATPTCGPFADRRFARLPASGPEVAGLPFDPEHTLRLRGVAATEAAVKERAAGRRVLHLATHAFFLGEGCREERGADDLQPLLRAGLALAGANRRAAAPADGEDGILTAEEIASLDLRGLEWAVLSACGTGVGAITAGEGVLGLARAFRTAGAGTTVMSLWPVDDEATRHFMQALYRARFVDGKSTDEAMQAASLEIVRARRARGRSDRPFYWAPFVASGAWR